MPDNNTQIALDLIANERNRQIEELGYTPESGLKWTKGELAQAGAYYAMTPEQRKFLDAVPTPFFWKDGAGAALWPFERHYFKPGNRLRELSKAGALIAAEIERVWSIRHDHIQDVVPIDLHNECNWDAWKNAFILAGIADGWNNPVAVVEGTDWLLTRDEYFKEGVSAIEAYKRFYYEDYE